MQALKSDRLADPQAAARQELEQRLVALGCHCEDRGELLAGEDLDLVLLVGDLLAVGQRQTLRRVMADQALALRSGKGGTERVDDVGPVPSARRRPCSPLSASQSRKRARS